MHELSLALALLEQVEAVARGELAREVTCVDVLVGPLSGVHVQALVAAWELARAGVAAQATLRVAHEPVGVQCCTCPEFFELDNLSCLDERGCPACDGRAFRFVGGKSFVLQQIEVK